MSNQEIKDKLHNRCNRIIILLKEGAPNIILENEVHWLNLALDELLKEKQQWLITKKTQIWKSNQKMILSMSHIGKGNNSVPVTNKRVCGYLSKGRTFLPL